MATSLKSDVTHEVSKNKDSKPKILYHDRKVIQLNNAQTIKNKCKECPDLEFKRKTSCKRHILSTTIGLDMKSSSKVKHLTSRITTIEYAWQMK